MWSDGVCNAECVCGVTVCVRNVECVCSLTACCVTACVQCGVRVCSDGVCNAECVCVVCAMRSACGLMACATRSVRVF